MKNSHDTTRKVKQHVCRECASGLRGESPPNLLLLEGRQSVAHFACETFFWRSFERQIGESRPEMMISPSAE